MFKKFTIIIFVAILAACTPTTKEVSKEYKLPEGLKDCTIHRLNDGYGNPVTVVRCPNSNTTTAYRSGKSTLSATVSEQ